MFRIFSSPGKYSGFQTSESKESHSLPRTCYVPSTILLLMADRQSLVLEGSGSNWKDGLKLMILKIIAIIY